ncbi:hypothetical protein IAU60_005668 [Kwoniella sp. DSM 27419]
MSSSPLRPLLHPAVTRSPNPGSSLSQHAVSGTAGLTSDRNLGISSASSSQTGAGYSRRADQVIYRFYLKTVNVLLDARLTHYGGSATPGPSQQPVDRKLDQWFNLTLPETDLYRTDLAIYRHVSSFQPYSGSPAVTPTPDSCTIPPLLVAFILDTSDLPSDQALLWCRDGGKLVLNSNLLGGKGKGKEKEKRRGIVLERWTLQAKLPSPDAPSTSQQPAPTAYRLGIIHFRALYSLIRLLPAYRLYRRLRRGNNGLRMGIKLWAPEGYANTPEGMAEAWTVMERDLVGLDTGLDELVSEEAVQAEECQRYDMPKIDIFGNEYTLSAEYRPEVDFTIENMEAVLSEKFVDMDEDWFKPTVARSRSGSDGRSTNSETRVASRTNASSTPTSIPTVNSPIPQRQQALPSGSLSWAGRPGSLSGSRPGASRVPSSQRGPSLGSVGTDRWGQLAEGLPFARSSAKTAGHAEAGSQEPPSPSMTTPAAIVAARRLSGHSIQPFASASPSASLLRSTPPSQSGAPIPTSSSARPVLGSSRPSSIGRTSSFLSQSGRSLTHAQMANMYAGSASPPITGTMSGLGVQIPRASPPAGQPPLSPGSLSFTKQPVPRSMSGRPMYMTPSGSSPFVPGSLDKDGSSLSSAAGAPSIIKRYSSSLSQRSGRAISGSAGAMPSSAIAGSQGSSADGSSLPGSMGQGLLRRTSTRESGLRHSLEAAGRTSRAPVPDEDDIQAFLKTLDALPQPPSLAAHAIQASRTHLPSTSSSLSAPSAIHTPSPLLTSTSGSPGTIATQTGRVPLTRQQIDDELKRMAGSFSLNNQALTGLDSTPDSTRGSGSNSTGPSSIGLLSASRPSSAARRVSTAEESGPGSRPMYRRQLSGGTRSPLDPGTASPVEAGAAGNSSSPMQALRSADQVSRLALAGTGGYVIPQALTTARSLPGSGNAASNLDETEARPASPAGLTAARPIPQPTSVGVMSPESISSTLSGADSVRTRRGPVLLRGGFGDPSSRDRGTSTSSSPSHSPVRDVNLLMRGVGPYIHRGSASVVTGTGDLQPGSVPSRGISERLAEDECTSTTVSGWRTYHQSGQGQTQGSYMLGMGRRQSAVSNPPGGNGYTGPAVTPRKGQRTAPSSLGREDVEPEDRMRRGRAERAIASESETPVEAGETPLVKDIEGLHLG